MITIVTGNANNKKEHDSRLNMRERPGRTDSEVKSAPKITQLIYPTCWYSYRNSKKTDPYCVVFLLRMTRTVYKKISTANSEDESAPRSQHS